MDKTDLLRLARVGAQARLAALQEEMSDLLRQFPDLRRTGKPGRPRRADDEGGAAPARRRRRKSTMTPEQRKAVSERMKKYWAGRRKKKDAKS